MKHVFSEIRFNDVSPETEFFYRDIVHGLSQPKKTIPCKYFYDEKGLSLFNQICKTEEYYPTRTELSIMTQYAEEIAKVLGPQCLLMEYGGGNAEKIKLLLKHLDSPSAYIPVDISREHLRQEAEELNREYPELEVLAVCADFTQKFEVPVPQKKVAHKVIYFPGSTIGNFDRDQAVELLQKMASLSSSSDGLLIGIDLKKEASILNRAYNDEQGLTKGFNLNLLVRINKELGGNFQLDEFQHKAFYNEQEGRIEMHLMSAVEQTVSINEHQFHFREGENIQTEYSYKYSVDEFAQMASLANYTLQKSWIDENHLFGVLYLTLNK